MNRHQLIRAVCALRDQVSSVDRQVNDLLAALKEDEIIKTLASRKRISTAMIMREFNLGYATASIILSNLAERGYVQRVKNSLPHQYEILRKRKAPKAE